MKNILLLDSEGKRVAVKYYSDELPNLASKLAFEKSIFNKTNRVNARSEGKTRFVLMSIMFSAVIEMIYFLLYSAEIGLYDGYIVVFKFVADLHFYVTGGEDENELILASVLSAFFDATNSLLRFKIRRSELKGISQYHCFNTLRSCIVLQRKC